MMRPSVSILAFLALAILQTSFFSSLPGALSYTPLVLAAGIYFVQHVGERSGAYWIAGFGAFLDFFVIPSFPLEVVAHVAAAAVLGVSARQIFSNRSWYGLVACGTVTALSLGATRAGILVLVSLRHPERVSWPLLWDASVWTLVLTVLQLTLLFGLTRRIRSILTVRWMRAENRSGGART